ncbi:MAG: hypothetical protein Q9196_003199 [Gyalolechia fulgens]
MKYAVAALTTFAVAGSAQNPPGCLSDFDGTFVIAPQNITNAPGQFDKRQSRTVCGSTPIITLQGGVLTDQQGRTGSIVANSQFQFDELVQENSLFTSGFSICQNSSLAIGGSTLFYQCLSGTFYNLYQQSQGAQCNEIHINTIPCEADDSQSMSAQSSIPTATSTTATVAPPTTASVAPTTTPTVAPMTMATAPVVPSAPPATSAAAPYPVGNGTAPASTGTASSAEPSTSSTGTGAPFLPGSGAATTAVAGNLVALLVTIAAFAMF